MKTYRMIEKEAVLFGLELALVDGPDDMFPPDDGVRQPNASPLPPCLDHGQNIRAEIYGPPGEKRQRLRQLGHNSLRVDQVSRQLVRAG